MAIAVTLGELEGNRPGGVIRMAIAEREAEVIWQGTLAHGAGRLSLTSSGVLDGAPVTWASRTEAPGGKTSPEELLAAAHATCFSQALALVLGKRKAMPERLAVHVRCAMDEVDGTPKITRSALTVRGRVPDLDEEAFAEAVDDAGHVCLISNALAGNVEITVDATLEVGVPLGAA
jgi:osmotically inducible protein OsmC